jgi:hypothetical protein
MAQPKVVPTKAETVIAEALESYWFLTDDEQKELSLETYVTKKLNEAGCLSVVARMGGGA